MDLMTHWQLRERPFEATWDARFFYASEEHNEALNRLLYLVNEQSMTAGMLSGEIGCGKTLTRAVFAERLDPSRFCVVSLENSGFEFIELLTAAVNRLEVSLAHDPRTKFELCELFEQALHQLHGQGRHLVLLLDEAQDMPAATLRELRWLTNFNGGGCAYLTLVLIGQPELWRLVAADAAIDQRISLRFHLPPLRRCDVAPYLRHRLHVAGHSDGEIFTETSGELLYTAARGIPREVNRLAKLALEQAWLVEAPRVEPSAIEAVVRDLRKHQSIAA